MGPARTAQLVRNPRALIAGGGVLVLVLVAAIGMLSFRLGTATSAAPTASPTPTPSASTPPTVSDVFKQTGPSVVVITTAAGSLGTGVVASDDGTILTANHVVSDGSAVTVRFSDGTVAQASVASSDPTQDIATLSPSSLPEVLVPAVLGGGADVGAPVIAIGNPLGLAYSVSSGVVSGTDRTADTDAGDFTGLIQFDAAVNPGSSGGPLLDQEGTVIGIVVSIADPGRDDAWAGIGFAVPIGAALGGGGLGPAGGPRI